jgi:hypothetical protein
MTIPIDFKISLISKTIAVLYHLFLIYCSLPQIIEIVPHIVIYSCLILPYFFQTHFWSEFLNERKLYVDARRWLEY